MKFPAMPQVNVEDVVNKTARAWFESQIAAHFQNDGNVELTPQFVEDRLGVLAKGMTDAVQSATDVVTKAWLADVEQVIAAANKPKEEAEDVATA